MDLECKIEAYPPPAIRWPSYKLIAKIVWSSRGGRGSWSIQIHWKLWASLLFWGGKLGLFEYSVPQLVTVTNNQ